MESFIGFSIPLVVKGAFLEGDDDDDDDKRGQKLAEGTCAR